MNFSTFNLILELPLIIFEENELIVKEFKNSDRFISELRKQNGIPENKFQSKSVEEFLLKFESEIKLLDSDFQTEIFENIFGLNLIEKQDLIRIYLTKIAFMFSEVLGINFDDDLNLCTTNEERIVVQNNISLKKIIIIKLKDLFQSIVDYICCVSIENSIDLKRIVEENHITFSNLNLEFYNNGINASLIKKGTAEANFNLYFTKKTYFDFFLFLNNNFDKKTSAHHKFSCIYRMMIIDGFLDKDLKAERFKRLIIQNRFINEIKYSIVREIDLSKKTLQCYQKLKEEFFKTIS